MILIFTKIFLFIDDRQSLVNFQQGLLQQSHNRILGTPENKKKTKQEKKRKEITAVKDKR